MRAIDSLSIGIYQADLIWESPDANLKKLKLALSSELNLPDLIVIPEMFTTGFSMTAHECAFTAEHLNQIRGILEGTDTLITGSFVFRENGQLFNRSLLISKDGIEAKYDKHHLFAFAGEHEIFSAGNTKELWQVNGWRVSPFICYDLRFPEWCRNTEYSDVSIFVASWPEKRMSHWRSLLVARAIENQMYVLGVNRVGKDGNGISYLGGSLLIAPDGEILKECGNHEGVVKVNLDKKRILHTRTKLPFLQDRDLFTLVPKEQINE